MKQLQPGQVQIFNRVAAKAESIGLKRAGQLDWYWANSYQFVGNDKLSVGCNCDPNIVNSPVNIIVMVSLPTTGKYAKHETKTYSIEEFERINGLDLLKLSNHVQIKSNEIEELEEKLKVLRKDLAKHVKKQLR